MLRLRYRPSPAMVVACVALAIALGGTSYAAINLPANSVGTKQIKNNAVISSKVKNRSLSAVDFKSGQLPRGRVGPAGPAGQPGPTGSPGAAGPAGPGARWAIVKPGGYIESQSGGIWSGRGPEGSYIVNFGTNVSRQLILTSSSFVNDRDVDGWPYARGGILAGSCVDLSTVCTSYGVANLENSVAVFTFAPDNTTLESHAFYVAAIPPIGK